MDNSFQTNTELQVLTNNSVIIDNYHFMVYLVVSGDSYSSTHRISSFLYLDLDDW